MTHCDKALELISSYLDGDITPSDREFLMSHIASCPSCAEIFNILTGAEKVISHMEEPPQSLVSSVMDEVRKVESEKKVVPIKRRKKVSLRYMTLAASAVLALSLGMYADRMLSSQNQGQAVYSVETDEILPEEKMANPQISASLFDADTDGDSSEKSQSDSAVPPAQNSILGSGSPTGENSFEASLAQTNRSDELSAVYSRILYVEQLPQILETREPMTDSLGRSYYPVSDDDLTAVMEYLDSLGVTYRLTENSSAASDEAAVVIAP